MVILGGTFIFTSAHLVTLKVKGDSYADIVNREVKDSEINATLVLAVIMAESGFQEYAKSSKGAIGLMQVLPETEEYLKEYYGLNGGSLYDGEYNIKIGCLYLLYLIRKFSNVKFALTAYNAGEGNVMKWLDEGKIYETESGVACPFKESERYVRRVLFFKKEFKFLGF